MCMGVGTRTASGRSLRGASTPAEVTPNGIASTRTRTSMASSPPDMDAINNRMCLCRRAQHHSNTQRS